MLTRTAIHVTWFSAAVFVLAATLTGAAMPPRRTTYFTFSAPVRLIGVLLPAGSYVFEIANPDTASNAVRVLDRKRSKVYATALTRTVTRPLGKGLDALIVFGEARPGSPRTISAWYPAGDSTGREFLH
jgi:hypothetical protein